MSLGSREPKLHEPQQKDTNKLNEVRQFGLAEHFLMDSYGKRTDLRF
jgi:hypothetical protein